MSGAIAALGDTLFKTNTLAQGFAQELSSQAHFLIRLRIFHPAFACMWVFLGFLWSQRLLEKERLRSIRTTFIVLLITQFSLGVMNWLMLAPTGLQLVHLLVGDSVFISFWLSGLLEEEVRA